MSDTSGPVGPPRSSGSLRERLERAAAAMASGDAASARRECIAVLAAAARAGDRDAAISALELLTQQCWWLGDMAACIDYGLRAIDRCHAAADPLRSVTSLVLVAYALCELELSERALPFAQVAHDLALQPGMSARRSTTFAALAHVHAKLGRLDEAERFVLEGLSIARESAEPLDEPRLKVNHASTLMDAFRHHEERGDTEMVAAVSTRLHRQLALLRALLARSEHLPAHYRLSVLIAAGTASTYIGEYDRARGHLADALASLDAHADTQLYYHALLVQAELELRSGEAAACIEVLGRIVQGDAVLPQTHLLHGYHDLAARAQRALGETALADEHGMARAKLDDRRVTAQSVVEQRLARWKAPFKI